MKNLKLLKKIIFQFLIIIYFYPLLAEETVDIWKTENISEEDIETLIKEVENEEGETSIYDSIKPIENKIQEEENLKEKNKIVVGIFDPEENNLTIDMWKKSKEDEIINQLKKIENINLSKDAENILYISLFTNSYPPETNLEDSSFVNYKSEWLIRKKKINLIKVFLEKNPDLKENENLIKFLLDEFLSQANVKEACDQLKFSNKNNVSVYIEKFKIYCLINNEKISEAQLQYDLLSEKGLNDIFFDKKINFLLGYVENPNNDISDANLLNFHLSHQVNSDFSYEPSESTSKYIWRYMSASNLIYNSEEVDLDDERKINLLEKAAAQGSYDSNELFNIYKRFLFNINQFLTIEDSYKLLATFKSRALLYQAILLSDDLQKKFHLIKILNELFEKDNISSAFTEELKNILLSIDKDDVPEYHIKFYNEKLDVKKKEALKKIKLNNKIIHRSKLLKYFIDEDYNVNNLDKDLESIYKKIRKNKKYFFSIKDIILLEALKSDGHKIPQKLEKLYSIEGLTIPTNLIALTVERKTGLVLLKIVEIIGEDKLIDLDPETLYFIATTFNKLGLKKMRNIIIINTLPERI